MSDREKFTPLDVGEIERGSSSFDCPHCGTRLQFKTVVKIGGVYELGAEEPREKKSPPPAVPAEYKSLSGIQRGLVDEFKRVGVYDAFVQTLTIATGNVPAATGRYFLKWLSAAAKIKTPQFAIRQCLLDEEKDAAGDLELWGFQYVAALIVDGEMRQFIPMQLVKGEAINSLASNGKGLGVKGRYGDTQDWVRTRNGYVVGRGLMFGELKKRAAGDFAKATGNY